MVFTTYQMPDSYNLDRNNPEIQKAHNQWWHQQCSCCLYLTLCKKLFVWIEAVVFAAHTECSLTSTLPPLLTKALTLPFPLLDKSLNTSTLYPPPFLTKALFYPSPSVVWRKKNDTNKKGYSLINCLSHPWQNPTHCQLATRRAVNKVNSWKKARYHSSGLWKSPAEIWFKKNNNNKV